MITFVCWLWGDHYSEEYVVRLQRAVARNYSAKHKFVCMTDRKKIKGVSCLPLPRRPEGAKSKSIRVWLFSEHARDQLGDDIVNLDLDMVICGDISPLLEHATPFKIWASESVGRHGFALNPSFMRIRGAGLTQMWKTFQKNAKKAVQSARDDGWVGQDQAVISHWFDGLKPPVWDEDDGIVSFRHLLQHGQAESLPPGARIVSFHGNKSWVHEEAKTIDWIKENWK